MINTLSFEEIRFPSSAVVYSDSFFKIPLEKSK